jgi:glycosyltransferase involved in cell wall biosynthesis
MRKIKCSLIIATYNWEKALHLCLESVARQIRLPDEVIIADDGSGNGTRKLIEAYQHTLPVRLLHAWHEDKGFRKTIILNKAIGLCQYEYIIQIDGDVILDKHFIGDHLVSAEKGAFIRGTRAMLTAGKTAELLQSQQVQLSAFSNGVLHRNNALRIFPLRFLGVKKRRSSKSVRGSNMSFWRSDFLKVNGYNNDLTGWGHEDEELAARLINAGVIKKIVKLCAVQYHLHHQIASRDDELVQRKLAETTRQQHIRRCSNGYNEVNNI